MNTETQKVTLLLEKNSLNSKRCLSSRSYDGLPLSLLLWGRFLKHQYADRFGGLSRELVPTSVNLDKLRKHLKEQHGFISDEIGDDFLKSIREIDIVCLKQNRSEIKGFEALPVPGRNQSSDAVQTAAQLLDQLYPPF